MEEKAPATSRAEKGGKGKARDNDEEKTNPVKQIPNSEVTSSSAEADTNTVEGSLAHGKTTASNEGCWQRR